MPLLLLLLLLLLQMLLLVVPGCSTIPPEEPPIPVTETDLVVLVHGMGRTPRSMRSLAEYLEDEGGYRTLCWGYSSFSSGSRVGRIGARLADELEEEFPDGEVGRIHFIGHSLGNIVIRWLLAEEPPERVGRVVMLAPPNRGARLADNLEPYFGWLLPPLRDLATENSAAADIPTPDGVEIGVIAGGRDGKVAVEETHLEGQADHVVVDSAHTFIMNRDDVKTLSLRFLREGRFGQ